MLPGLKTAVSIPDTLFSAADRLVKQLQISRSELYARALERFIADEPDQDVTALLDDVYRDEPSRVEPELRRAQRGAIADRP